MRNLKIGTAGVLLSLIAGAAPPVVAAADKSLPSSSTASGTPSLPAATGRLKFKSSGPVCMCGEGLSEKDIEQALAKLQHEKSADQHSGSAQANATRPDNNLNSGAAK